MTEPHAGEDRTEAARTAQPTSGCVIAAVVVALLVALIVIIVFGLGALWFWRPSGVPGPGVTILAEAPGLAPEDVEIQVARPIESQVSGAAGVQQVRSASRFGTCSVSVDFEPKTNIFEARQRLAERLQRAKAELPPNVTPVLAPISVSEREVLLIGLHSIAEPKTTEDRTTNGMNLRTLAEHDRRLDLMLVYDEKLRSDPGAIADLLLETPTGSRIPLGRLADVVKTTGPVLLYRENMMRRIVVSCNVQGRDRTAVLTEIRQVLHSTRERLKPAYHIEYAGCALAPGS
jgi:Cu/Ag efflux pump CusA